MLEAILNNDLLVLFTIILTGYTIGMIKVKGVSLGNSACLFTALAAGALGARLPPIITNLGIIFFVYSIGLTAGPRFFHQFKQRGLKLAALAIFSAATGMTVTLILAKLLRLEASAAVGAFSGALTSTPTLAAAIDALKISQPGTTAGAPLSYALTYPIGLVFLIVFIQIVLQRFAGKIKEDQCEENKTIELNRPKTKLYKLENANLDGKTLEELNIHKLCHVNITRIRKSNGNIAMCTPSTTLHIGDVVVAVGTSKELDKFQMFFGKEVIGEFGSSPDIKVRDLFITSAKIVGKPLKLLKTPITYGITITRLRRGDIDITPTGDVMLEMGDLVRIVGTKEGVEKFSEIAGSEKKRLDETNVLILAAGMLIGTLLGEVPWKLGGMQFKLGAAGGPLLVALTLSHFGKIGKWSVRLPNATKFFIRELGLVFFLVGIGIKTGGNLPTTIVHHSVISIIATGALTVTITMIASLILASKILKISLPSALGAICGSMTSTPALGTLMERLGDDSPSTSYAAVYPVATIVLTMMGQLMVWFTIMLLDL